MEDRVLRENHEKIRQEFTANVSHELKTPLTSISGYAELMASGMVSQEDIPSFAAQIQKESARMIALVTDIIKLTELDSGALQTEAPPEMEPVDLQAVAQASAERLRVRAQRAYVTISVAGESVTVSGAQNLLEELCDNLVENAVRYNRPGGPGVPDHGDAGRPALPPGAGQRHRHPQGGPEPGVRAVLPGGQEP
ncbi:MAG: HAMP domain-containing histidine kinase [Clostridiales bacterium]|nr:HAMP domain-containing histidine kinase [Clostridiales bacterium]